MKDCTIISVQLVEQKFNKSMFNNALNHMLSACSDEKKVVNARARPAVSALPET